MDNTKYNRTITEHNKGLHHGFISCELNFSSHIPDNFYIVLRDEIHAISMDVTEEKLMAWLQYIREHKDKEWKD